jgi:outer membrane protein TolC
MSRRNLLIAAIIIPSVLCAQNGKRAYSLDECVSAALEHNQKIKMAKEQVDAADELKKAAFTQYLPNFSVNGAYTHQSKDYQLLEKDMFLPVVPYTAIDAATGGLNQAALSTPAVAASTFVINPATGTVVTDASGNPVFQKYTYLPAAKTTFSLDNLYVVNGGFTQPVYLGGKIRTVNKMAEVTKQIAQNSTSLTTNELVYSVEEAYWRIVSLLEKVKMAESYRSLLVRLVSDLENIRREGIITDNDLLKARLKLSESEMLLLKAKNGLELSKMALAQITGIAYSTEFTPTDSLNGSIAQHAYTVSEDQITDRPELKILKNNVEMADAGVKLMRSRYLPNIMLNAGYTTMNPSPYAGFAKEFGGDFTMGLVANIPIFHFGDKLHTLKAAKHEKDAADLKLQETKELMVLQLQQGVYQYNEAQKKTEYATLALKQSEQNLKYTDDNFREGVLKTTDLLEAQLLWQKANSELIDARTDQQMAASNLKKMTGKY